MGEFVSSSEDAGFELPDIVLCFELLTCARLDPMSEKLALTGVDYTVGKEKKDLLEQMKKSLRKYFTGSETTSSLDNHVQQTLVTTLVTKEVEEVLIANGWTRPSKKGKTSFSRDRPDGDQKRQNYRDRNTGKIAKCFICACKHEEDCTCPCTFHLGDKCPAKKSGVNAVHPAKQDAARKELGLFMATEGSVKGEVEHFTMHSETVKPSEDFCLIMGCKQENEEKELVLISSCMEELCLISQDKIQRALIDCACPTTVTGLEWLKKFLVRLSKEEKDLIKIEDSEKIYKFGGGGTKHSKYVISFPIRVAGRNTFIKAEVIDSELPLLLGNSTLRAADAVLYINQKKVELMGHEEEMKLEPSGKH